MSTRRLFTLACGAWPSLVLALFALRISLAPQVPVPAELATWLTAAWFPVAITVAASLGLPGWLAGNHRRAEAPVRIGRNDGRRP